MRSKAQNVSTMCYLDVGMKACASCSQTYLHMIPGMLHIHTHIYMYIYIYIHIHIHIHTHIYKYTYIHTYMHACIHTYLRTYIHTYVHIYTDTTVLHWHLIYTYICSVLFWRYHSASNFREVQVLQTAVFRVMCMRDMRMSMCVLQCAATDLCCVVTYYIALHCTVPQRNAK